MNCFYVPGSATIIDVMQADGRSQVSGETLDEIRLRYPGAEVGDLETVHTAARERFKAAPEEITEERFCYFLGVLPPVAWQSSGAGESFHVSELVFADIATICARVGERYFTFQDAARLTHDEIVRRCMASLPQVPKA